MSVAPALQPATTSRASALGIWLSRASRPSSGSSRLSSSASRNAASAARDAIGLVAQQPRARDEPAAVDVDAGLVERQAVDRRAERLGGGLEARVQVDEVRRHVAATLRERRLDLAVVHLHRRTRAQVRAAPSSARYSRANGDCGSPSSDAPSRSACPAIGRPCAAARPRTTNAAMCVWRATMNTKRAPSCGSPRLAARKWATLVRQKSRSPAATAPDVLRAGQRIEHRDARARCGRTRRG